LWKWVKLIRNSR